MSFSQVHSGNTDPGIVTEQWFAGKAADPLVTRDVANAPSQRTWLFLIGGAGLVTAGLTAALLLAHSTPTRSVEPSIPAASPKVASPPAPIVNDVGELRARLGGMESDAAPVPSAAAKPAQAHH